MRNTIWWMALTLLLCGGSTAQAETGMASFYPGIGSGSEMTCAHRSHAFGKRLRVTHGNISIECRVNDRGPFIKGRIIDVSTSAARALGMMAAGVVRVTVEDVAVIKARVEDADAVTTIVDESRLFKVTSDEANHTTLR